VFKRWQTEKDNCNFRKYKTEFYNLSLINAIIELNSNQLDIKTFPGAFPNPHFNPDLDTDSPQKTRAYFVNGNMKDY